MDTQLESLKILIEGIKLAQKRGAFTLEESSDLWKAIKTFIENDSTLNESNDSNLNN
jgi:hypothetical protein